MKKLPKLGLLPLSLLASLLLPAAIRTNPPTTPLVRADQPGDQPATSQAPTWNVTGVLLIDRPPKAFGFGLQGREEGKQAIWFEVKVGTWDPRLRITRHATLPVSRAGWHFTTGSNEWTVPAREQEQFRHHVFLADRPVFHEPGGKDKERVLHLALSTDRVSPADSLVVRWQWFGGKSLAAPKEKQLTAFVQQAPAAADDAANWQPLPVTTRGEGRGAIALPAALKAGLAWLRVGLAETGTGPTGRLLAEVPLIVKAAKSVRAPGASLVLQPLSIGPKSGPSQLPDPWKQRVFLAPQSVSALDVSDDGTSVAVATMAFRHDRNFWLLSEDGKVQSARYVEPWAPLQAAVLPGTKAFAVGLAYSRFTDPSPTVSLLTGEKEPETALVDAFWNMGWLRYGQGDWRTGWPVSAIGDLIVRARGSVFTVASHDGAWRMTADGRRQRYPLNYQRPFRLAASTDGHVLAFGYLIPDVSKLDEKTRQRLRLPPALLTTSNALTAAPLWSVGAMAGVPPPAPLPEPAEEFPDMAENFNMKPLAVVPFRVVVSAALSGDGARTAITEYAGWLRIKRARGIGGWNPPHQAPFCPRQRGWLRVFGPTGQELVKAELPAEGLFEVHMSRRGDCLWCVPLSWFARGLAGRPWLPADRPADTVFVYDLQRRGWSAAWRFPDAVSDLAVHPHGERVLISCWDGNLYLVDRHGRLQKQVNVGSPARVRWSGNGRCAVAGTQAGVVWALDERGQGRWQTPLPVAAPPPLKEPLRPVFAGVPIYSVGRVGKEHAYVGDIWLIKTNQGGILVDTGGTSGIPFTWQRLKAAGVQPRDVRYVLLSHSHGDHAGAAYLWRTQGARIVAPATAAFTVTWLMPTWSDYSIWVPTPIDVPLRLKRPGDEQEFDLCALHIKAIFVPGHSFDSVLYALQVGGKRILFTGDIGFEGGSHILHRCWGDADKALVVARIVRQQALPFHPDHVLTGHGPRPQGTAFLEDLLLRTEAALRK
jgi:glyoxylase-like metal-dependent hydrolase (beta-lactamase superfamily II)